VGIVLKVVFSVLVAGLGYLLSFMIPLVAILVILFVFVIKKWVSSPSILQRLLPYTVVLLYVAGLWFLGTRGNPKSCDDLGPQAIFQRAQPASTEPEQGDPAIVRLSMLREDIQQDIYLMLSHATEIQDAFTLISEAQGLANSNLEVAALPLSDSAEALTRSLKEHELGSPQAIRERIALLQSSTNKWLERLSNTKPGEDLSELRREFDAEKLKFSLESVYSKMHELQTLMNSYLVNKRVVPTRELTARLDEDSDSLVFEERIHLYLNGAEALEFDFSGIALYWNQLRLALKPGSDVNVDPHLLIGYGSLKPYPVLNPLKPEAVLSRGDKNVSIIHRITVRPALHRACTWQTLFPFRQLELKWPLPNSVRFRGRVKLLEGKLPLQATFAFDTDPNSPLEGLLVPQYSFFASGKSFRLESKLVDGKQTQYLRPDEPLTPNSSHSNPVVVQLFPDCSLFRNTWVQGKKEWFFPVNAWLGLIYLLLAAGWAEYNFRKS